MSRKRPNRTQRRRGPPRCKQLSFTLVEVLVALSLTTLLLAAAGRIAAQSILTRQEVTRVVAQRERELAVLDRLEQDVARLIRGLPGPERCVMVFGTPRQTLQLAVLSPVPDSAGSVHLPWHPAIVRYRTACDALDENRRDLVREVIDRTKPGAKPVRETLARGLTEFHVAVLCEGQWIDKYPLAARQEAAARAVRVSCRWSGAEHTVSRTFVVPHAR